MTSETHRIGYELSTCDACGKQMTNIKERHKFTLLDLPAVTVCYPCLHKAMLFLVKSVRESNESAAKD